MAQLVRVSPTMPDFNRQGPRSRKRSDSYKLSSEVYTGAVAYRPPHTHMHKTNKCNLKRYINK